MGRFEATDRVRVAWRELKRGASMNALRPIVLGPYVDVVDWGGLDALDVLASYEAMRMSELADALRVDASTATRAVHRLRDLGLVERVPDPHDRRAVLVRATESGREAQAEVAARRAVAMARIVEPFSPAELATLADLMERLVASVDDLARSGLERGNPVR